jgi:hypothetical protein
MRATRDTLHQEIILLRREILMSDSFRIKSGGQREEQQPRLNARNKEINWREDIGDYTSALKQFGGHHLR